MSKVCVKDCSKDLLQGMAKSVSRMIDGGRETPEETERLRLWLDEIIGAIPTAPDYCIEYRRRR